MWEEPSPADLLQAVQLPPSCSVTSNTLTKPQTVSLCREEPSTCFLTGQARIFWFQSPSSSRPEHCAEDSRPEHCAKDSRPERCAEKNHHHALLLDKLCPASFSPPAVQELNSVQRRTTVIMFSHWTGQVLPVSGYQLFKNCHIHRMETESINNSHTPLSLVRTFRFWCPSCSRAAWLRKRTFTAQREALGISLARQVRRLGFSKRLCCKNML